MVKFKKVKKYKKVKKVVVTKKNSRQNKVKRVLTVAVKGLVSAGLLTAAAVPLVLNAAAKAKVKIGAERDAIGLAKSTDDAHLAAGRAKAAARRADDARLDAGLERANAIARRNDEIRWAAEGPKRPKRNIVLA